MASVSGVHIQRIFCPFLWFDKLIWIYKLGNPFRALRWKMQLSTQIESKGASFVQKCHFIKDDKPTLRSTKATFLIKLLSEKADAMLN